MQNLFVLALIIVLVSGLIAYIGDWVGRKLGRKRLTLFGLRPKHTAIVISVCIGMLIALLTLSATFAVSAPIRKAFLTPIDQLTGQLHNLKKRVGSLEGDLTVKKHDLQQAERELERAAQSLQQARTKTQESQKKLKLQASTLAMTNARLAASVRQRQQIERELAKLHRTLRDVQGRLDANQHQLVRVRAQSQKAREEYQQIRGRLSDSNERLVAVTQLRLRLENERLGLEKASDELKQQMTALNNRIQWLSEFARIGFAPLAFTSGQELVSGLIPARADETTRRELLAKMISTTEQIVRQRSPEMAGETPAILFMGGTEERPVPLTQEEAVVILSERVTRETATEDILVRLAPINNVPVNGQALIVPAAVLVVPNYAVYVANSEVARISMSITAQTSEADVMGEIADNLLRERVPAALREKDVAMVTRRFNPAQCNTIPDATRSQVPWDQLLAAADQACANRGKRVSIIARTRTPMNRYDPLNLVLDVEPAP